jgi:hypothetical protein
MPDSNESFMDGSLGLGMAIPEEATAKLGPLPSLMGSNRTEHDEVELSLLGPCAYCWEAEHLVRRRLLSERCPASRACTAAC